MFIRTPILFVIPLVLLLFIALFLSAGSAPAAAVPAAAGIPETGVVAISIDYGDGASAVLPLVEFMRSETMLAVAKRAFAAAGVSFGARDYGAGMAVTEVGGRQNGTGDRYWEYMVNGARQQESIDRARLSPGDTLEWKFALFSGN